MTYEYKTNVRMHQTDSAGVVFYSNLFVMAHDCYEAWLNSYISLAEILQSNIQIPIVHAEADYKLPIGVSDEITIEMSLEKQQQSSFTLHYRFKKTGDQTAAQVQTVHAVIDGQTHQSIEIPPVLQEALASL